MPRKYERKEREKELVEVAPTHQEVLDRAGSHSLREIVPKPRSTPQTTARNESALEDEKELVEAAPTHQELLDRR